MDCLGNVNATRMGDRAPGAGGFVDITSTAKNVVFCSTFTGGGLEVSYGKDGMHITKEGRFKKLVKSVQQISYNGKLAFERGQNMYYVTERAVFRLTEEGPVLIEVAKGVDLQKDILDQMEFVPKIAENLQYTPTELYFPEPFGLKSIIHKNKSGK